MNALMWIFENWSNILVAGILLVSLYLLIKEWFKETSTLLENASNQEKLGWLSGVLANMYQIALVLVTDAEINFGGGTGPIKKSWVISQLYSMIPEEFKKFVSQEQLSNIVEMALTEAKKLWEENSDIHRLLEPIH